MDWLVAMSYGALGGAVVEVVVSSDRVLAWNAARHEALTQPRLAAPGTRPALSAYLDPLSDVAAGVTRILLGAVAGLLFHSQVTGAYAAIAVGCSAPTVLRQLGSARLTEAFELHAGPALELPTPTSPTTPTALWPEPQTQTQTETAPGSASEPESGPESGPEGESA